MEPSGTGNTPGGGTEGDKSRLPTFKCPRDLSLTGKLSPLLRSRKTFVPNIPPKRDRPTPAPAPESTTPVASNSKTQTPRGGQRGRGRDAPGRERKKPELVQASSIFSGGVGDGEKGRRFGGARGSRFGGGTNRDEGEDGGIGGKRRGRFGSVDPEKLTKDNDEAGTFLEGNLSFQELQTKVHEMIGDGKFIADLDEEDENVDKSLHAVELPLSAYLTAELNARNKKPISVPLKAESFVRGLKSEEPSSSVPQVETDVDFLDPLSFAHAVISAPPEGTVIFFQMPDHLPVLDQTIQNSQAEVKEAKLSNNIGSLPEGYIGKMQILSSGATRLLLGENSFDILPAKPVSFRQELVAIDLEEKKMTALGPVQNKFLVIPDLEQIFRQVL